MDNKSLKENIDYIINAEGLLVFTKSYLLKRGYCCQSGCVNCPYGYSEKSDPLIPAEFKDSWSEAYCEENCEEENDED